jgi:hypothetical protein
MFTAAVYISVSVIAILLVLVIYLAYQRFSKEGLTSTPRPFQNTMIAANTGLGTIDRDPRFEPGPQCLAAQGSAIWSHGGHAGGPTFGSFTPYRFLPGNNFDTINVHGFGERINANP